MSNKYNFGWSFEKISVEIPELDAFVADIRAVCQKHGIGFNYEKGWSDDGHSEIELVPFDKASFDFITGDLDEYRGGVPWLDRAKAEWKRLRDECDSRENAARQERALAARREQERAILENGVVMGGKTYKLVEQ